MRKLNKKPLAVLCGLFLAGWSGVSSAVPQGGEPTSGMTLQQAFQQASVNDASLAQQRALYAASQESVKGVEAALLPQIRAEANYSVNQSDLPNDASDVTTQDVAVTLNQVLYDQAVWSRFEQADYVLKQADLDLQQATQNLMFEVVQAYLSVLLAQEDVALAEAKQESDQLQLQRAQASVELGLASRADELQAQSNLDLTRSEVIQAQSELDIAKDNLARLTGQPVKDLSFQLSLPKTKTKWPLPAWVERAANDNLIVKSLSVQLQSAQEEVNVQKAGHSFTANLQAQIKNTDYSDFNSPAYADNVNQRISINLALPLYSGGATSAKVSEARAQVSAAQQGLRDAREEAKLSVRTLIRNLQRGQALVAALQQAVESQAAFLETAREGYKVGLKSMLEVLSAETNLFNAQRNLTEAVHAYWLNHLQLESTVGDLNEADLLVLDKLLGASQASNR